LRFPKRPLPTEEELKEETEWIYSTVFKSSPTYQSQFVLPKIQKVLEFLRVHHLEIPYIYTYKKGFYAPDLNLVDLWEIYEWDEKWSHLQTRKATLRQLYTQANVNPEYFKLLDESQSETEVQDLFDHFQMYHGDDAGQTNQQKRAVKRDFYKICKKTPVSEFSKVRSFAYNFGDNLY
jgi:transcription elongation factor SPT6